MFRELSKPKGSDHTKQLEWCMVGSRKNEMQRQFRKKQRKWRQSLRGPSCGQKMAKSKRGTGMAGANYRWRKSYELWIECRRVNNDCNMLMLLKLMSYYLYQFRFGQGNSVKEIVTDAHYDIIAITEVTSSHSSVQEYVLFHNLEQGVCGMICTRFLHILKQ